MCSCRSSEHKIKASTDRAPLKFIVYNFPSAVYIQVTHSMKRGRNIPQKMKSHLQTVGWQTLKHLHYFCSYCRTPNWITMGCVEKVIHTCASHFTRSGHSNTFSQETTTKGCAHNYTVICPYSFKKQSQQNSPIRRYDPSEERVGLFC